MLAAALVDLTATAAALDPATASAAHTHAAATALLRMLRDKGVREAARAALSAALENEPKIRSVELATLAGLLGAATPRSHRELHTTQAPDAARHELDVRFTLSYVWRSVPWCCGVEMHLGSMGRVHIVWHQI